jgi:murein DD-endopeptidase MepM/ murein hydrolase activator NlpD
MLQRLIPVFLLIATLFGFGALLARNAQPVASLLPVLPTEALPTDDKASIAQLLNQGFAISTAPPTIAPQTPFDVPTLAFMGTTSAPVSAAEVGGGTVPEVAYIVISPTPPPVLTGAPGAAMTMQSVTGEPPKNQPPALIPPLSRDLMGYDHYWFFRPIDSNANNQPISYYSYGSDGPDEDNPLRVHHGIDMPNPVGVPVRAAGSGKILWAADGRQEDTPIFQNSPSYGNVIIIEHDFSYHGQPLYTLYAHLSASFVEVGQYVQGGEVIGQVGNSGNVTGPHVHFEVRVGEKNNYASTYNPILWMVPYVGNGVIAGRVIDRSGLLVPDAPITIRSRSSGQTVRTGTSYIILDTGFDVNSDPNWNENFAVADVPVGRYDVIATIYGERVVKPIEVLEGMTSFIEIGPLDDAAPTATATEGS